MGTRGPVPKRSAERRRRNKPAIPIATGTAGARTFKQPDALPGWDPAMRRWYKSLAKSGQAEFYEPSDWEAARFVAAHGTTLINDGLTARGLAALLSAMGDLLTTEGARRRAGVELQRKGAGDDVEPEGVTVLAEYRADLEAL